MAVVLSCSGVSKRFGVRPLFENLTLAIHDGQRIGLTGPNGSGKSTLLQVLAGILSPLTGRLALRTADARTLDAARQPLDWKREVFWCGPGALAFDHLCPAEYFTFLSGLYPRWDAAALNVHLQALALAPCLETRLAALSTGTQRKVWLAAALAAGKIGRAHV